MVYRRDRRLALGAGMERVEEGARTGADAFVLLLRFHQIAVDPAQIRHQFAGRIFGPEEILRCAKGLKLKARAINSDWQRLKHAPLPALAVYKDGHITVLGRVLDDKVLIQDPAVGRPQIIGRAEFEARWSGRLVLIARRASLGDLARQFDITRFVQAIYKYRSILSEV